MFSVHYMYRNFEYIQLAFKYFIPESMKFLPIRFGVCLWWKLIPPSVFRGNIFDDFRSGKQLKQLFRE